MEKQISIIIPTYNMEAYLGKCIESMLIPEIDQVEILIVNDGSKDRSSEIAHHYANLYPNSIKVIDKENGNYGSCINAALPIATGRYVKILDADDTFDTQVFSDFVKILPDNDADLLFTRYVQVDEEGKVTKLLLKPHALQNQKISIDRAITEHVWYPGITMHGFTYKRSIFDGLNYHQTTGISFTDSEWVCYPLRNVKTVKQLDFPPLYKYLLGREGQTMDPKRLEAQFSHLLIIINRLIDEFCKESESGSVYFHILRYRLVRAIYYTYLLLITNRIDKFIPQITEMDQNIKNLIPEVYEALDKVRYTPYIPFSIVKSFRKSGYSPKYKIPRWVHVGQKLVQSTSKLKGKFF